jgi:26S proteasome regulatory subunit T5
MAAAMSDDPVMDIEIQQMATDEIISRTRLIENEIRVLKNEHNKLAHEDKALAERIKENNEKIKLNKQLPYLVGNIVEVCGFYFPSYKIIGSFLHG